MKLYTVIIDHDSKDGILYFDLFSHNGETYRSEMQFEGRHFTPLEKHKSPSDTVYDYAIDNFNRVKNLGIRICDTISFLSPGT